MGELSGPLGRAGRWLAEHEAEILAEQIALCEIPAPTGAEAARAEAVAAAMAAIGLVVERDAVGNVIGLRAGALGDAPDGASGGAADGAPGGTSGDASGGTTDGATIVISSHLDTVFGAEQAARVARPGEANPYRGGEPTPAGEYHAPGISDAAAGLAVMLALARALEAGGVRLERPLLFLATVGEEGRGDLRGARHFFGSERGRSAAAFVTIDHSEPAMIVHRGVGSRRYAVEFRGAGGHSWAHAGRYNAAFALSAAASRLGQLPLPDEPRTTYNVGVISAPGSVNAIPASASLLADLRSESAEALEALDAAFQEAMRGGHEEEAARRPEGAQPPVVERIGERPAGRIEADVPLMRSAVAALEAEGLTPRLTAASTDANAAYAAGVPAIAMSWGGRSDNQHSTLEWFSPVDRARSLRALLRLICDLGKVADQAEYDAPQEQETAMADDSHAYNEIVLDHFRNPRNAGELAGANAVGEERNPVCGDHMRLMLRIEGEEIAEARFQTRGCAAAIATSSVATEVLIGMPVAEAASLKRQDFVEAVGGLPKSKIHCSVLAAAALKRALADYRARA